MPLEGPGRAWTTEHRFAAHCADPGTTAVLLYRRVPLGFALERGYELRDAVVARVIR